MRRLPDRDLLVVNALRWRMQADRYAHLRDDWAFELSAQGRDAIERHVAAGRGVLAVHTAAICFDDWSRWSAIVGAGWNWERSSHPPVGVAAIAVDTGAHPIVHGVDDFTITDEIYGFMDVQPDVRALATSPHGGAEHPLLWAREVAGARVVYDALGHDERSYAHDTHRTILRRAGAWVSRAPDSDVVAA